MISEHLIALGDSKSAARASRSLELACCDRSASAIVSRGRGRRRIGQLGYGTPGAADICWVSYARVRIFSG
jgi:hypothetical protein